MEMGQVVDYVIEYNRLHNYEQTGKETGGKNRKKQTTRRVATQNDWDAFWG